MLFAFISCCFGFALLFYGAEWLVKGSSSLARSLGITPMVIGLTVVAFSTSSPELVVSVVSSLQNKSMIAVGNVIGSNICNIALILGISAMFQPIVTNRSVFKRDIPIMLGISLYLLLISLDSSLSRMEGASLLIGLIAYIWFNYKIAAQESAQVKETVVAPVAEVAEIEFIQSRKRQIYFIVGGGACIIFGAEMVVRSAVLIMTSFGVSEKFIGLTIVAFGTSLPELATSVVAAYRKEMDISIGNLVGSNVFNILSVLGVASLLRPIIIPGGFVESGLIVDYLVMLLICSLPWFMMRKTLVINRRAAFILLASYFCYLPYLMLKA